MNFHFTVFMKQVVCFISPKPLARGYKTHNKFHKYHMKWKFISDSFYHMIIQKKINISWKNLYFEKIPRENRPEASGLGDVLLLMISLVKKHETGVKSVI